MIFWDKIEKQFYSLAYKENCLMSIKNEEKDINLDKAKKICNCMLKKIEINNIKLNTSKLHAYKSMYNDEGEKGPIDQLIYKKQCKNIL